MQKPSSFTTAEQVQQAVKETLDKPFWKNLATARNVQITDTELQECRLLLEVLSSAELTQFVAYSIENSLFHFFSRIDNPRMLQAAYRILVDIVTKIQTLLSNTPVATAEEAPRKHFDSAHLSRLLTASTKSDTTKKRNGSVSAFRYLEPQLEELTISQIIQILRSTDELPEIRDKLLSVIESRAHTVAVEDVARIVGYKSFPSDFTHKIASILLERDDSFPPEILLSLLRWRLHAPTTPDELEIIGMRICNHPAVTASNLFDFMSIGKTSCSGKITDKIMNLKIPLNEAFFFYHLHSAAAASGDPLHCDTITEYLLDLDIAEVRQQGGDIFLPSHQSRSHCTNASKYTDFLLKIISSSHPKRNVAITRYAQLLIMQRQSEHFPDALLLLYAATNDEDYLNKATDIMLRAQANKRQNFLDYSPLLYSIIKDYPETDAAKRIKDFLAPPSIPPQDLNDVIKRIREES